MNVITSKINNYFFDKYIITNILFVFKYLRKINFNLKIINALRCPKNRSLMATEKTDACVC